MCLILSYSTYTCLKSNARIKGTDRKINMRSLSWIGPIPTRNKWFLIHTITWYWRGDIGLDHDCYFSSLASLLYSYGEFVVANSVARQIKSSLFCQSNEYSVSIRFSNATIIDRSRNKVNQCLRYEIKQWKIKDSFDIINDISDNLNLVQLVDILVNFNHEVSIVKKWIFDSNY